jgi:hypothetical protein
MSFGRSNHYLEYEAAKKPLSYPARIDLTILADEADGYPQSKSRYSYKNPNL